MDPQNTTAGWFQYIMSGVGGILTLVAGVVWRRQDGLDTKLDTIMRAGTDHALEDERQFAKKDDMRHLYEIISRQFAELKENQERNVERLSDKIDALVRK